MSGRPDRVKVKLACGRHQIPHDLCVPVDRGVPPELRCADEQEAGYGPGGGSGCALPSGFHDMVKRELRDNFQASKRQGFVLVRAA